MKLLVQEYLETHSFGDLAKEHGVYASFSKSGHKRSLNYDQIEAKEIDPIAQESRGLILSADDGRSFTAQAIEVNGRLNYDHITPGKTRILAYPMKRFFNYGQGSAANIDWSDKSLTVLEKMDGTLCIVYFDPFTDKWCVATRSVSEADLPMDNGIFTFRSLFEKALEETSKLSFDEYTKILNRTATYCFELTTPYNRIVVFYPENRVTLLAIRLIDYELPEFDIHNMLIDNLWGVPIVKSYKLESVEKTLDWVSSLNPLEHEGVVVKQGDKRIKVKNPAYVAYNKVGVQSVIKEHDQAYVKIKSLMELSQLSDKKSFALSVQELSKLRNGKLWQAPFFQMFDGKAASMKEFIHKSRLKDGSWGNPFLDKILELSKTE